jgi:cysteine desulfurase
LNGYHKDTKEGNFALPGIIYFDNSATTRIYPEVLEQMNHVYTSIYGNPSSLHKMGSDADKAIQQSRERIADALGVSDNEIYFTSGGTESNNWAIKGVAKANKKRGRHILTSATEHPSVLECFSCLETEGFISDIISVDSEGLLNPDMVSEKITNKTILFSFTLVNNETGAIQNASDLIGAVRHRNPRTIIHIDAVQAFGKIPLNLSKLDADLVSLSSHKIHGPKGCGALYIKRSTHIVPIIHGGGQERKYRSGTENVPGIYGFALACEMIHKNMDKNREHVRRLKNIIINGLSDIFGSCPHIVITTWLPTTLASMSIA